MVHEDAVEVVVLVHGSPGSPRNWDAVVTELAARVPQVEVMRPSIPGWEQRAPGAVEPLGFDELVDGIVSGAAPGRRRVLLVGFSAGGLFALAVAARRQWNLAGLVLLEPMGLHALELVGDWAEARRVRAAFERYFRNVDEGRDDPVEPIMDEWYPPGSYARLPQPVKDYLHAWAPLNVRDGRAGLNTTFERDWFERIDVPTVLTYGMAAPVVWQHFAEALAELLPDAATHGVPGGTHALLDTHPCDVCDLIENYLTRGE